MTIEFVKLKGSERDDITVPEVDASLMAEKDTLPVIVATKAKDWCLDRNKKFTDEANKSFPRKGVACCECDELMVLSNKMFELYQKHSPKVLCGDCVPKFISKNKNNE